MIRSIDLDLYNLRDNERDSIDILQMPVKARYYYFLLYSFYSHMLLEFLKHNTIINKCDNDIFNSSLQFKVIDNEEKDFYQSLSSLNYYYIRNNLYLNRLTKEENDFLRDRIINNNYEFDNEMNEFIKNTFKKLISENREGYVNFGPRESNHFAPSNSLVIGVRYDELASEGLDDNNWYERFKEQKVYLETVCKNLLKNINETLDCNCYIFEYNDYSVKKKNEIRKNI